MIAQTPPVDSPATLPALLDVRAVATLLDCSARHVYRLSDSGRMPAPVKLGALIRWRRDELTTWLDASCPSCQPVGRKGRNR
jgi:excisionase family DNA binding protein